MHFKEYSYQNMIIIDKIRNKILKNVVHLVLDSLDRVAESRYKEKFSSKISTKITRHS